ncbi:MAG TPA: S49 family peptidase [Candidatus Azoamicus sp.]
MSCLDEAFNNKYSKAIILKINSPGGTPVQSNIIHNHIKKLRKIHVNKPIYSVIEDIGTSGAYLIAVASDKIYCDPYSIVGSIGVVVNSFGFSDAINRLGIERRIYKAGKNKVIMDPFLEKNLDDEKMLQHNLDIMHNNFINLVKENRYKNLDSFDESNIFSGKFWVGKDALYLGLVDGFHDIYSLSSDVIKSSFFDRV